MHFKVIQNCAKIKAILRIAYSNNFDDEYENCVGWMDGGSEAVLRIAYRHFVRVCTLSDTGARVAFTSHHLPPDPTSPPLIYYFKHLYSSFVFFLKTHIYLVRKK